MKLRQTRRQRRGGFTFIELMVVIVIIALLISLLTGAVINGLNKMDEVSTRHEISAMSSGLVQFQADFNLQGAPGSAPPSRLWLDESDLYTTVPTGVPSGTTLAQLTQLRDDSRAYLKRVWPRLNYFNAAGTLVGIDWNGDGVPDPTGSSSFVLEGEQLLVFWLGGQKTATGVGWNFLGFSADPANPMNTAGARKGPYFQLNNSAQRLKPAPPATPPSPVWGSTFPYLLDPYGQVPYGYFSSGKSVNGYNAYALNPALGYDCPSLLAPVPNSALPPPKLVPIQPYYQPRASANAPLQYYKPDSFQIVSAGKDGKFWPGGQWAPAYGASGMLNNGQGNTNGADDLTNFYDAKLGTTP